MENTRPGGSSSGLGTDWQLGCSELKQRGGHLLQSGQWADCTFIVGAEPHQMTIKAHKLVLASASPVFEAMFFGGMAEGDGPIKILDVQPDAFKILLLYIYTDKTIISSFDKACSIFYAAKKYMLPYLEKECTWFISLNLDPQNVCRAYELAMLFDENLLVDKCLKMMETQTKEIVTEESFLEADPKTLNTLLSLERLNIENELDLFYALERYAKVNLKRGQLKRRSKAHQNCTACGCSMKKIKLSSHYEEPLNCTTIEMNSVMSVDESANCSKSDEMERHEETGELVPREAASPNYGPSCPVVGNELLHEKTGEFTSVPSTPTHAIFENNKNVSSSQNASMCSEGEGGDMDRSTLALLLGRIRFLSLSAAQFAAGPARSPLLRARDAFALLLHIVTPAAPGPLPAGFSASRLHRNQQNIDSEMSEGRSEAVFRFTVLNFKMRRRSVESRPFLLHDAAWSLRLLPRYETDTNGFDRKYMGLYLKWVGKKETPFACRVKADIKLVSQTQTGHVTGQINKLYTNLDPEGGIDRLVSWDSAVSVERGLLLHNALTVEARLLALPP